MSDFVHLHLHTQYSVLDGAAKIPHIIERAVSCNQNAVAITDHGNMHGAIEFYSAAKAKDVKPILGCEVYFTPTSRFEKITRAQGGPKTHHLTLLAMNKVGYQNLCRLVSLGYMEGFYFKPRIDREILEKYNEGLICLSGCLSGELANYSFGENIEGARDKVKDYLKIFGDRYYLEVQPHQIREQQNHNKMIFEVAKELGVPTVATTDCHYINRDDHYAQEVLMCVSTGKLITDPDRLRHEGASLFFKSAEEMRAEMPGCDESIKMSVEIAKRCEVEFDFSTYHMPKFAPPKKKTIEQLFKEEAAKGLADRYAELEKRGQSISEELKIKYQERLQEEIDLILEMGFEGYFLVVSDFIRWAKSNDIPVGPGRGSAAGSLVAYALSIVEIDPIKYNLLFERFLNPERVSLPDIDVDFCIFGRDKVIEYVCEKYGRDKVAQIVTFGTLKAKAAIKDVGRVLGMSFAETDKIAKLIPAPRQGFDYPIAEALKMEKRLRDYADGEGRQLIELAMKLEGLCRHTSTHAAGLVIADRPVVELLPLMMDKDNQVVTQFSMNGVEKIGLVKFDFLGLKTLTVLQRAVSMIKADGLADVELNALPLDDPKTYKMLSSKRTVGVFQLESSGITEMVGRLKPNCFEDIVAILALYRPGPLDAGMVDHYINRKHEREPVQYIHPLLNKILKDTYGIILYQEQIMQIARDLGGYSLGEADMLRRAMGKKKPEEMAKHREKFIAGAMKQNATERVASEVFNQMETFARYGFNRSHSVAYALISFQTAYLKAHYPLYLMAALMTFEMNDTDKTLKNLAECREMKLEVLPPNVNHSRVGFNVSDKKILFGLAAIKGVGQKAVEEIIAVREKEGDFVSLLDFCKRVDLGVLNKRTLENLIKSGAFDCFELPRAELLERYEEVVKRAQRSKDQKAKNQISLFSGDNSLEETVYQPNRDLLPEWPTNIKLGHEKDALGFYLSGHPLEKFERELQLFGTTPISALSNGRDSSQVTVAGVVTLLKLRNTKKGDRYANFVLEDRVGTVEVIVWPDTYQKVTEILNSDDPVLVSGRLDVSDDKATLVASEIQSAVKLRDRTAREAHVVITESMCDEAKLDALKSVLLRHHGNIPVKLIVKKFSHSETVISLPDDVKITPSEDLSNKVEQIFGEPVLTFR